MFRVRQSQILPQALNGLLSRFNGEAAVKTVKTKRVSKPSTKMDAPSTSFRRRRRASRLVSVSGPNIRSTWF